MSSAKRILSTILQPAAIAVNRMEGLRRLWAHARAASLVQWPVPESAVFLGTPEIRGSGRIRFGEDLYLFRDLYLETQEQGEIEIGNGVVISRGAHIVSFTHVSIGEGTMIGEYASIRDANHRFGGGVAIRYSGHDSKPITIGRNVWIACGVTVLPGVTIGDGAVVGASAVVTKDVGAGEIVAGVPARPLRSDAVAGGRPERE
jgi:acetyltransferase-like isoleucine patch superfamily enzyme